MNASDAIKSEIIDNIGIIRGMNPPVNALSHSVRTGLVDSLAAFEANKNVEGIILIGEGKTFFATKRQELFFVRIPSEPKMGDHGSGFCFIRRRMR